MKRKIEMRVSSGIARPLGLHFNHYVSLSVRPSDQHYLTTGMCNSHFWLTRFAEHHIGRLWSVSESAHNSLTAWYILLLIHFFKLAGKMTKKRKYLKKKILVMSGFEPLCTRLLDYKKAPLDLSATIYDIHTRAIYLYTLYLYTSD